MVENLKTTRYQNGDPISYPTDTILKALPMGIYCWHNNDAATYKAIYGALYNWYAVNDSRNIASKGWHVPTKTEWTTLINYLGGEKEAGTKMCEEGITHWWEPLIFGTNSSGFTAIPGPLCTYRGEFYKILNNTLWWSSTESSATSTWGFFLINCNLIIWNNSRKADCSSVRCLQD